MCCDIVTVDVPMGVWNTVDTGPIQGMAMSHLAEYLRAG